MSSVESLVDSFVSLLKCVNIFVQSAGDCYSNFMIPLVGVIFNTYLMLQVFFNTI